MVLPSKLLLCKAYFKILVREAVNTVSVFRLAFTWELDFFCDVLHFTLMLDSAFARLVKLHNISRMSQSLETDICFLSKP